MRRWYSPHDDAEESQTGTWVLYSEAAEEMARLRAEVEWLTKERDEARAIATRARRKAANALAADEDGDVDMLLDALRAIRDM